ncbi:MAG: tyrosine--tRNA ligase, partial [Candidatus Marinimicrobia bacterium]|nr:tyrosine--tRNA ligase [Candidatus Neomarinimicrobiota bacterium]
NDLEVVHNSSWLSQMTFPDVIELSAQYTVAQMLGPDDFSKRYKSGVPISIHEFLYPLAQAQDSVALNVDVELGGTDQLFNLLVGRELQRQAGQEPQIILTMPLLEGTDGKEKMSKSMDNYVGLTETADQMYGKLLSIPDDLILKYFVLTTDVPGDRIQQIETEMKAGANPRDFKRELARAVVSLYYDDKAALEAENSFDKLFIKKQVPDDMPEYSLAAEHCERTIVDVLTDANILASRSEVRRMIRQNAVSVDDEKIEDEYFHFAPGHEYIVKVGKRKFLKVLCD